MVPWEPQRWNAVPGLPGPTGDSLISAHCTQVVQPTQLECLIHSKSMASDGVHLVMCLKCENQRIKNEICM